MATITFGRRSDLMETQAVNWGALDALVLDYVDQEQLLEDSGGGRPYDPNLNNPREIISIVRLLIEAGHITESLHLLQQHAQIVLEDPRLLFRLYKQNFIELLRAGGPNAHMKAIECSRTHLGPCALDAYPEAYDEFKRVLLALMYDKDDESSPIAEEWSEVRRTELAATVSSTLTAQLQAYDPLLSSIVRYLISIHDNFCQRQALASPILHICSNLLSKDRDPPATPQERLLEAPKFSESDVQDLAQAVEISRQGAVDSLRFTGGDLSAAFKNELSRFRVNVAAMDELVREYCMYRGLVKGCAKGGPSSAVAMQLSDVLAADVGNGFKAIGARGSISQPTPTDTWQNGEQVPAGVGDNAASNHQPDTALEDLSVLTALRENMDYSSPEGLEDLPNDVNMEEPAMSVTEVAAESFSQGSCSMTAPEEIRDSGICSTSGSTHLGVNGCRSAYLLSEGSKVDCRRRRWQGRKQFMAVREYAEGLWNSSSDLNNLKNGLEASDTSRCAFLTDTKMEHVDAFEMYARALEIRQLASEGKTNRVILETCKLNPNFFEHNPQILFQLKQVEFLKLIEGGDLFGALSVARADLGPLAARFPDLLKPLKETLLALARPSSEPPLKPTPPSVLAAALQVALGASLGIAEPQLMKVMRASLYTHTQWCKLQMCPDRFADFLNLNTLKEPEAAAETLECTTKDLKTVGESGSCMSTSEMSGSQLSDALRDRPLFDDASVLTLMEFLALSRGDAIRLLMQYDGSVENVIQHIVS
nr:uncharacterized protein LOC112281474 isoform X3 [Physcomitrium patens]|eukprot:XP_024373806.1 uncharacterized protein LOC112281474 isoform X3 [Physcomitrella patens]